MSNLNLTPFLVTGRVLDINQESDPVALSFSVRKTNSLYSGPCCRIRRNDGTEKDIGFTQTDIDIQSILNFVGKGDAWVTVWYDQSNKGYHATQQTWDLQPRIVIDGNLVTDPDAKHLSIQFDGRQYLDTTYTPQESDVKAGAIQIVGSAGITTSSTRQGGSVYEYGRWSVDNTVKLTYPLASIPKNYDLTFLESYNVDNTIVYTTSTGTYGLLNANVELDEDRDPISANVNIQNIETSTDIVLGEPTLSVKEVTIDTTTSETSRYSKVVDLGNSDVLAVPFNERNLARINDTTGVASVIPYTFTSPVVDGMFKTAVVVGEYAYCIPWNYGSVVKVPRTNNEQQPTEKFVSSLTEKFMHAVVKGTDIYCIPFSHNKVVKIDTDTFTLSDIDQQPGGQGTLTISGSQLFATGSLVGDRYIVCPPYNAATVLRIDTQEDKVELIGSTGVNVQLHDTRTNKRESQILGGGRGYTSGNPVGFELGGTVGNPQNGSDAATFTATVQLTKIVTHIELTNPGSGYIEDPVVDLTDTNAGGTWSGWWREIPRATADRKQDGTIDANVNLEFGGDGAMPNVGTFAVTFRGGKGVDAIATTDTENGQVVRVNIQEQGSGYSQTPTVQFVGGNPVVAATVTDVKIDSDGRLENIEFTGGQGYKLPPQVRITGGKGTSAQATAYTYVDGKVTDIQIDDGGSNYTVETGWDYNDWINWNDDQRNTIPQITIDHPTLTTVSDGGITHKGNPLGFNNGNPQAVARISEVDNGIPGGPGEITGIEILWAGSGYMSAPVITVKSNGGTTASLIAEFKQDGRLDDVVLTSPGSKYLTSKSITFNPRLPSEAASGGAVVRATATMYLDGNKEEYRYRSNTPLGNGKFLKSITYDNAVFAFPYNTYRCLKIEENGTWTELLVDGTNDFGLDLRQFVSSLVVDNKVYVLPEEKNRILKITGSGSSPSASYLSDVNGNDLFTGEWSDAALAPDSKVIYAVPKNSEYILTVDTKDDTIINRFVVPVVSQTTGPNKFSSVTASSSKILYACPEDGDKFVEINPGSTLSSRTTQLPAPSVMLQDHVTLVYPPTNNVVETVTINTTTNTVTRTARSPLTLNVSAVLFGDGCLLPNNNVVWIPYYSVTSSKPLSKKVIVYNPSTNTIVHISSELDTRYVVAYPTRSAVALSSDQIVWVPKDSTVALVKYTISTGTLEAVGTRDTTTVSYATATSVSDDDGNVMFVGSMPNDTQIENDTSVTGFTTNTGTNNVRYEDSCMLPSGHLVLAPAGTNTFKTYLPDTDEWTDYGGILFTGVGSIKMGGVVASQVDGKAYTVPFNHSRVLVLDVENDLVEEYGNFPVNGNLWRGAVESNYVFGVPYDSNQILVIDPLNANPLQKLTTIETGITGSAKWWGGVLFPSTGEMYCAPFNDDTILVIIPGEFPEDTTWRTIAVPQDLLDTASSNRWCNPCLGPDNKLYFAPYNSSSILIYDPTSNQFDSYNTYSLVSAKYTRILLSPNNTLYLVPYRERSFVEYDVFTKTIDLFGDFGISDLKFQTATYVPQTRQVFAFQRYLPGVIKLRAREQYLAYYNAATNAYTKGAYINTEFKMKPKVDPMSNSILFYTESVLSTLTNPFQATSNLTSESLVFSSPITPGVLGWYEQTTDDWIVASASNDTFTTIVPSQGGFCGASSFSRNTDFYAGVQDNVTFVCRTGNNTSSIPYLFDSLYSDGVIGVFGMYSDATRVYTFYKDREINRELYTVDGDVGSTFSIGRIFGQQYAEVQVPGLSSTISGLVSEILVFKTDVKTSAVKFGENQNFYFRETSNPALNRILNNSA